MQFVRLYAELVQPSLLVPQLPEGPDLVSRQELELVRLFAAFCLMSGCRFVVYVCFGGVPFVFVFIC